MGQSGMYHQITAQDCIQFLDNFWTCVPHMVYKAHVDHLKAILLSRFVGQTYTAADLVAGTSYMVYDLERGCDSYTLCEIQQSPGIMLYITPLVYTKLWRHLPPIFLQEMDCYNNSPINLTNECAFM
jgi:hypothetical protein